MSEAKRQKVHLEAFGAVKVLPYKRTASVNRPKAPHGELAFTKGDTVIVTHECRDKKLVFGELESEDDQDSPTRRRGWFLLGETQPLSNVQGIVSAVMKKASVRRFECRQQPS